MSLEKVRIVIRKRIGLLTRRFTAKVWPPTRKMPRDIWGATQVWLVYFLTLLPYSWVDRIAWGMFRLNTDKPRFIEAGK